MSPRNRQLAAIVFTDIAGYSALMREEEDKAIEIRLRHREVFDELTQKYGGKILQYYGDGTLSIFQSAVAAVECSVEMQRAFQQEPKVPLRIGIHTGDITYSEEEVYGTGLNIASRVESACYTGGVLLSAKVYDDISNHAWLKAKSVGFFEVKGMSNPLELYAITNEGIAPPEGKIVNNLKKTSAKVQPIAAFQSPGVANAPVNLAKKFREGVLWAAMFLAIILMGVNFLYKNESPSDPAPTEGNQVSIAVLPFSNFSTSKEDEYFSDGITEDILSMLSKIDNFQVISRTSTNQYKGTNKSMKQIGKELNATHVLEGSVRRDNNKVRIVAQLIDTKTDDHVWAETYDREITEIFEVQSLVAEDIAMALENKLSIEDQAELRKKPTDDLQAYDFYLQGREYYRRYTPEDNEIAINLFQKAIEVDSSYALAYAGLGDALGQKAYRFFSKPELLDSALAASQKAIDLDEKCSEGYKSLGLVYQYKGQNDKAMEAYEKGFGAEP